MHVCVVPSPRAWSVLSVVHAECLTYSQSRSSSSCVEGQGLLRCTPLIVGSQLGAQMHACWRAACDPAVASMVQLRALLALRTLRCPSQCVYVFDHTSPSCQLPAANAATSRERMMGLHVGFA